MDPADDVDLTDREMFLYACGDADRELRVRVTRRLRNDPELAAKIAFFRLFVPADDRWIQRSVPEILRIVAVCAVWGYFAGWADNHYFHFAPRWFFKPLVAAALLSVLAIAAARLMRRPFRASEGTVFESLELPLYAIPAGLVFAVLAVACDMPSYSLLGYFVTGLPLSLIGSIRGAGLRAALLDADGTIPWAERFGRAILYFVLVGQFFACFTVAISIGLPSIFQGTTIATVLDETFLWSGILFGAALAITTAVRLAIDDRFALKSDGQKLRVAVQQEGVAAFVLGVVLLAAIVLATGNFKPVLFPLTAGLLSIWWACNMVATEGIHGSTISRSDRGRLTVAKTIRRSIKITIAAIYGLAWRKLLFEPYGIDAVPTLIGIIGFLLVAQALEKMPIPVESWLRIPVAAPVNEGFKVLRAAGSVLVRHLSTLINELLGETNWNMKPEI